MTTYKYIEENLEIGSNAQVARTDDDGVVWYIPINETNADYQAYLAWKAEQPN